ncbi:MAG: hypothetical protein PVF66_03700 [Candidatus Aminicenantes bacterium]|jgi:hypothetical protein
MKRTKFALKILAILPCVLMLVSCQIRDEHSSSSILLVVEVAGYTAAGDSADFLQSDVIEGDPLLDGSIVADIIPATLEAKLKEPASIGAGPSYKNRIFIHTYEVRYTYVDSLNMPSTAVPATFQGRLSVAIDIDSSETIEFVIVREQAKAESPLSDIIIDPSRLLQVVAQITFYGEDIAGHPVQATGYLTIYFAEYADA